MERIPQSVAIRVPLQAYLSTDHVSAATGKTIAITISKNGAAYGNPSAGATNATEIASGSYYVDLSTTDTGTVGPLFVLGTASGVDSVVAIYDVAADVALSTLLTTQMNESYRANGAAPTLAQALCELLAHHGEAEISGTTKTIKKLDHSTTAETFTLDSATAPTSVTRAS